MFTDIEPTKPVMEVHVASNEDLWQIRELAQIIFPATYDKIVSAEQVNYMMNLFYNPEALRTQQASGQVFLILYFNAKASGYASYTKLNPEGDFRLNKIYLDQQIQGKGLGRFLLNEVLSRVKAEGGRSLRLNVYRFNKAVGFYRNMGFQLLKEELLDIGGGHILDDFVMEIKII